MHCCIEVIHIFCLPKSCCFLEDLDDVIEGRCPEIINILDLAKRQQVCNWTGCVVSAAEHH